MLNFKYNQNEEEEEKGNNGRKDHMLEKRWKKGIFCKSCHVLGEYAKELAFKPSTSILFSSHDVIWRGVSDLLHDEKMGQELLQQYHQNTNTSSKKGKRKQFHPSLSMKTRSVLSCHNMDDLRRVLIDFVQSNLIQKLESTIQTNQIKDKETNQK